MDATVASGAAAMMAIRVLLDHDVPEENIMLLSLIMAKTGTQTQYYNGSQTTIKVAFICLYDTVNISSTVYGKATKDDSTIFKCVLGLKDVSPWFKHLAFC